MSIESDLIHQAARLARLAPSDWNRFVGAFQAYSEQIAKQCIQSPLDELPRSQGRAQATAHRHGIFRDCTARADKLEERKK